MRVDDFFHRPYTFNKWILIEYQDSFLVYRLWDGKVVWVSDSEPSWFPVGWKR